MKLFLILLLLITPLSAKRLAKLIYYQAPPNAPKEAFLYQLKAPPQQVELTRHNFSSSIPLGKGDQTLVFLPEALAPQSDIPFGAPRVKIPKEWNQVLLFLFHDPENQTLPFSVKAINANDNAFGPGDLLFLNYSDIIAYGSVGNKELNLKPKSREILSNPIAQKGAYNVNLNALHPETKKKNWLLKQSWVHLPDERCVVIITPLKPPRTAKLYVAKITPFK